MKKSDKAYLAGIIDGEGCIAISRNMRKDRPSPAYYEARISLGMTAKNVIDWACHITDLGTTYVTTTPLKRKKQWLWRVSNQRAITIAKLLLPFLKVKQKQARLLVLFQKHIRKQSGVNPRLTAKELTIRDSFYHRSRKLNSGSKAKKVSLKGVQI